MPTRFAKQLVAIFRGAVAIGMTREEAMTTAMRTATDSMPPMRRQILLDVAGNPNSLTADVVKRLQLPRQTVDRTLQELHLLGLLVVDELTYGDSGKTRWIYSLAETIDRASLARFTRNVTPRPRSALVGAR
jgi:hypothetical protein